MTSIQTFGRFKGLATASAGESARAGESLATSGTPYARRSPGPRRGGRMSATSIASGTFAATMTVWYSNLPNPDPAVITDWWQDTTLGTITLSAGTTGYALGNLAVPWVLYRVTVTSGTLNFSQWVSYECS